MAEVHLIKLCVGAESITDLSDWQKTPAACGADGLPRHVTRMWPKRAQDLLRGGSLYWVIKGTIQCRQQILRFDEVAGEDGKPRCALVLDPRIVPVAAKRKRPFQGWRYLAPADAPPDRGGGAVETELPPGLAAALSEIGVLIPA